MRFKSFILLLMLLGAMFLVPSTAPADDWNRLSTVIFDRPVQIPGQVLPAGIYVFKLAELSGEHNVVQVWNADQTILYATVMGLPEYKGDAPSENRFILEQREDAPALLKSWFHEGTTYGERFVYSKNDRKERP
jgi:hypothetical protein